VNQFSKVFKNLKLGKKFNLLLTLILLGGIGLSGLAFSTILNQRAQNEVSAQAMILLTTMNSVREYTNTQVHPLLKPFLDNEFLPESIAAYSAREVFENFRKSSNYNEFFYKEATLNPTNLRDLADSDEAAIVEKFRQDPNRKEMIGFRQTSAGNLFYIARPIAIKQESCLACHSTPDQAPKSLIERYGSANGFGWTLNEIVGAQIISVPAAEVVGNAQKAFLLLMGIVLALFTAAIFAVNQLLRRFVIRPIRTLSEAAVQVSTGQTENIEFPNTGKDEVGDLATAFNRMKLSLGVAMRMLEESQNQE
jgi:HAMP domain-containing protein